MLLAALCGLLCMAVGPSGGAALAATVGHGIGIPNVRVSHSDSTSYGQPALAVNPRNPHDLLGVAWSADNAEETFVSRDGGSTWRNNGPLPLPDSLSFGGDPSVAFDARGVGFVASLGAPQSGDGVYIWRTDNGGRSFHLPIAVVQGQPADHPWLAVDPTSRPGGGELYIAWATRDIDGLGHAGGLAFSRSTDGGHRFSPPRIISAPLRGVSIPVVAAGPRGVVSVAYVTLQRTYHGDSARPGTGDPAPAQAEVIQVVTSTDNGRNFGQPAVLGPMVSLLPVGPDINLASQPSLAIEPRDGGVYAAYSAYHVGTGHADIMLTRSDDDGHTWSAPLRLTATSPSDLTIYAQPHVVVDDAGDADVTFFALAHGRVDLMLARAAHGHRVGPLRRITDTSFDPSVGWHDQKTGAWWIGDYQGLAEGGGRIYPFWGDTRTGRLQIFTASVPSH
jgi:hypothetical protein